MIINVSMISHTVAHSQYSSLVLTVATDKQTYYPKENVTIYGNLTQDETLVPDGLVAIQVKDSKDETLVIRTTTTGTPPPGTPYVKVRSVVPCDSIGMPKDSFKRNDLAWFNLTVTNYDIEPRPVLITVNIYDSSNTPRGYDRTLIPAMVGQTTSSAILCVAIPEDATLGNATAYGNAYTDWPSLAGWPYCTEKSAPFNITDGGSSQSTTTTTPQVNGNYNITFQLAARAKAGNYTIYVSSRYWGVETFNNTKFKVELWGDFDGDGDIDGLDTIAYCRAYANYWLTGEYNPLADFDGDGDIDGLDTIAYCRAYVFYWAGF